MLLALLAQAAAAAQDLALDRIRDSLAEQPAIAVPQHPDNEDGTPVFRVRIQAWTFGYKAWENLPGKGQVPSYVKPSMPLSHFEFMENILAANRGVTPEEFRAMTLYPGVLGVTFDPGAVKTYFAGRRRAAQERSAREEVRRDLEAYLRARAEVR